MDLNTVLLIGFVAFCVSQFALFMWMRNQMKWQKSQDEFAMKLSKFIIDDRDAHIKFLESMRNVLGDK